MNQDAQERKPGRYDPAGIEPKWQRYWEENGTFRSLNPGDPGADPKKPKYYILDMFPYPSGAGLHVGHPLGYCATDIVARYKRMCGFNVLHPMGFDAFGLPAEQYAVEHNVHPDETTRKNINMYRRQLKMFGFSYDWSREFATCDASYYKHTQWMFKRLFESWYDPMCEWIDPAGRKVVGRARPITELVAELEAGRWGFDANGVLVRNSNSERRAWSSLNLKDRRTVIDRHRLAFVDEVPVNWCPALGTVLSNEEVDNEGRSDRGGHPVFRRPLKQWMLRITAYCERLLADLDDVDWPESIKLSQRNWIGRSVGAEVVFPLAEKWTIEGGQWTCGGAGCKPPTSLSYENFPHAIRIYTTRPDTLFGATYVVLAPEHELVSKITTPDRQREVDAYVAMARNRSELDRTKETKEKSGVFTGAYAINPVNGAQIPIWIADYVLTGYGTGAIMAVPGSDTRDFEFATRFNLPIVAVVKPTTAWIDERLAALTADIDAKAATGFDEIARKFPDIAAEISTRREQSAGLGKRTKQKLHDCAGHDRLIAHYVAHPQTWGEAFVDDGWAVQSPADGTTQVPGGVCHLNGLTTEEAKSKITNWLQSTGVGRQAVKFKLRDWLFSRQRYWGEPFPILHGEHGEIVPLDDAELPLELPPMRDFRPTSMAENSDAMPEPPLGRAKEWTTVSRGGKTFKREVNTMPQWAGSCWYYLRFIDPHNEKQFCSPDAERYWMPVDLYVGGAEHAVLHLLYARFWHKVLFDLGFVHTAEPFKRLFNQGMIQSFAYCDERGRLFGPDVVESRGQTEYVHKETGEKLTQIVAKMSKALKNVVNPDEIIAEFSADTFRMYEMYMGPLDSSKPWNTRDVPGLHKLCQRIWRLVVDEQTDGLAAALTNDVPDEESLRTLHKTIKRVTEEVEQLKLNTAIAAFFDFVNAMTPRTNRPRAIIEPFVLLLAPFAPHLAEELWSRLGHTKTLAYEPWPKYDEKLARDESVEVAVQVNGKVKSRIFVAADADEKSTETAALADEKIAAAVVGKTVRKVIVARGRLVNIVVS